LQDKIYISSDASVASISSSSTAIYSSFMVVVVVVVTTSIVDGLGGDVPLGFVAVEVVVVALT
jgi:hypothetical protein